MSSGSVRKPLHIPGKRLVLTKNMILESQKQTRSASEASRWLKVSYSTYKKWAKYYGVFEQHLNPKGFGVKTALKMGGGREEDAEQKKTRETKEAARKQQKEAAEAAALLEVGELDDDEDEWLEYIDDTTGEPYYVNAVTGETRWDLD